MWVLFALVFAFLAMVCWGFGDFLIQRSVRRVGDVETMAFTGLVGAIILTPLVVQQLVFLLDPANAVVLGALCVLEVAVALTAFEAFKRGKLSVTDVIIELELPVTVALAFVFFNEAPTTVQIAIMLLIFVGLILVATKSFKHHKKALERGVLFALVAALLMGSFNFLIGTSSRQLAPLITIWGSWLFTGMVGLAIIYNREGLIRFGKNISRFKKLLIATAIFDMVSWLFYAFATTGADIGIITAITESYTVIGMVLGLLVNKEKIAWHQALGGAMAIGASILLALTLVTA